MSYQVNWEIQAMDQAAGSSATIPSVSLHCGTLLASSPMSRGRRSRSLTGRQICGACGPGATVFYTIDEERRAVQIDHVARLP